MIMTPDGSRARKETENHVNHSKTVEITIWEGGHTKEIMLQPAEKRVTVRNFTKPKDKSANREESRDLVAGFRSLLLDARDKPGVQRESLGEKEIDGRRVVGFRLSGCGLAGCPPDSVMILWGDPKSGLPVRVETTMAMAPNVKVTMSDFAFNVEMDESLFSIEPPAGYEVIQGPLIDASPAEEKDLVETFRDYSQWSGGPFPALLDSVSLSAMATRLKWTSLYRENPQEAQAKQQQKLDAAMAKLQRGLWFTQRLPKEADSHYSGKGVSLGAADKPIFWYRPKDAKKYRVIYADLSVRDAATPPSVPDSRPDPEPEEKDLVDTFRCYSELSGLLPSLLDMASVTPMAATKWPLERSAKEVLENLEVEARLLRGLKFVVSLPPEADAHYAGRGVSPDAADRPIFWYRPKDNKKYRVIYADFSVRDAATPPSMPVVQPEQDLIDTLRYYSELSGGAFPNVLDIQSISPMVAVKQLPPGEGYERPSAKYLREVSQTLLRLQRGLEFGASLPAEAEVRYAGRGVSFGAADKPIFCYRPKGGTRYRVIYADLSVRDVAMPPSMPVVQPEQDLTEMFRYYSELSGGAFPDSLDKDAWIAMVLKKKFGLEERQTPNAKQMLEFMEIMMLKVQPGVMFADSLPPAADAHYAGKGVSLGAADMPIFWYRPKDSKKYRVTYGDLSVREADTPPNVPNAQRLSSPSRPKR